MEVIPGTEQKTVTPPPPGADGDGEEGKKETVSADVYSAVKNDLHKQKQTAQALQSQLDALKSEKLKEQENWKEYAKTKETEAEDWKGKYNAQSSALDENAKLGAVREECIKLGLRAEAMSDLDDLDFKEVVIEVTDKGRRIVHGASAQASKLKLSKPHWFQDKTPPKINGGDPRVVEGAGNQVTQEMIKQAEETAAKTGNWTEAKKLTLLFKQQQAK